MSISTNLSLSNGCKPIDVFTPASSTNDYQHEHLKPASSTNDGLLILAAWAQRGSPEFRLSLLIFWLKSDIDSCMLAQIHLSIWPVYSAIGQQYPSIVSTIDSNGDAQAD